MEFNEEQRQAIRSDAKNVLVLAGAGTGKTRTIIGRALHLLEQQCEPDRMAVVTFTRRAASEIRTRLTQVAGANAKPILMGTFHHLCLRIMSARRQWFGLRDATILDRDDQSGLIQLIRAEFKEQKASLPTPATLLNYYSYSRNTNQSPEQYLKKHTELDDDIIPIVLDIFLKYRDRKESNGYLDYDDILHRFAKVLHDDARVRKSVCSRFNHMLVDEMQDTNPLQWLILESFAEYSQLFCVGDDAQSIYAFRGADFANVHSFVDRLPDAAVCRLQHNYRSTQPILDLANWLLDESPLDYDKHLIAERGTGPLPQLVDFNADHDESHWIVDQIKQRKMEGAEWSENMILCRTAYAARPIEAELIAQRVPYRFVGGMSLLQMAHVKDLLSLVRVATNHRDELAWLRYLTLWPKIGDITATRTLQQIIVQDQESSALETLRTRMAARPDLIAGLQNVQELRNAPKEAIKAARKTIEPIISAKYAQWDSRKRDLDLLERLAEGHRQLSSFLETYTLDPVSATEASPEQDESDEGCVTLITVHSAKGTECEVCYVPAVVPGNYPHMRSLGDADAVEEERRVLYVAFTRAKDELIISRHLSSRRGRASWNYSQGTEYLLQFLPEQLVDSQHKFFQASGGLNDDLI